MTLEQARDADRRERYEEAADLYEAVIAAGDRSSDVLLDLAGVYWEATDPGIAAARHTSAELMSRAGSRLRSILEEAVRLYSDNDEVCFWKKYIEWADLGEPLTREECLEMLRRSPDSLAPVLFLLSDDDIEPYAEQAQHLLELARARGTARDRYARLLLEGYLKRARRTRFV